MASIVGGIISTIFQGFKELYTCFKPHYDYVKELETNYKKLNDELDYLVALKRDMNEYVMTHQCRNLKSKVRKTEAEIEKIETEYQSINSYLCGLCPFSKLRKLGKHIVETIEEIDKLKKEAEKLEKHANVITERRPESGEPMHATDLVELTSQSDNVQKLLNLLRDEKVKRVVIWGMEGIGKTTLLKKLNDKANKNGRFDSVIWVSVRRVYSLKSIQKDLLRQLKLNVNDIDNMEQVAATISKKLENMRYLVLLDDVTSVINLDKVGIHSSHKYGKFVFASTQKTVYKKVEHVKFEVKSLPPEDMRTLFRTIVGDAAEKNESIMSIGDRIIEQLSGLPLLIKVVASSLKNEYYDPMWNHTLWILQSIPMSQQEHLKEVSNVFEHVYSQLLVDRRRCLLYAALFPRDYEIYDDYLVECWRSEQFIRDVQLVEGQGNGQPFTLARERGHKILENLTESSLLERCTWKVKYITMPEQFRIIALNTFYQKEESCTLLVEAGDADEVGGVDEELEASEGDEQIKEHPVEEKWRPAQRISLMCDRLHSLPKRPKCHKITTLLIQRNVKLQQIPKSFFTHMSDLLTLDLYQTGIESLPSSLFSLINLKGLYLNKCCRLAALPSKIAKLQKLEVLDIRDTGIQSLPIKTGELSNLKCFRVSFRCNAVETRKSNTLHFWKHERQRVIIPPNVVRNLCQLEELTIIVDPKEQRWNEIVDIIAKEVASLKKLTTLSFYFPSVESLKTFINSSISRRNRTWRGETFRLYKLLVGFCEANHHYRSSVGSAKRLLRFSSGETILPEIKMVLEHASAFELIGHCNVKSLSEFGMANMESLEVCVIEGCNQMGSIVECNGSADGSVFPALKKLHIIDLPQLNCLWRRQADVSVLPALTTLTLNGCTKLTKILSYGIAQQLEQLQYLRVENCHLLTEIIGDENHSPDAGIVEAENQSEIAQIVRADNPLSPLPSLETLELVNLPRLISICQSDTLDSLTLKKIEIKKCQELCYLSLSTANVRELSLILCQKEWWEAQKSRLQDDLRQHLERHCRFIDEEVPSVDGTPPEASACHGSIKNQPHDSVIIVENLKTEHASSSTTAAAAPPIDPSPSNWVSQSNESSSIFHKKS